MKYRLTIDDLDVLRFLSDPLHELPSYPQFYRDAVDALVNAVSILEVQIVFNTLEAVAQQGACQLARRMSYVAILDVKDSIQRGDIVLPVIFVEGYGEHMYH